MVTNFFKNCTTFTPKSTNHFTASTSNCSSLLSHALICIRNLCEFISKTTSCKRSPIRTNFALMHSKECVLTACICFPEISFICCMMDVSDEINQKQLLFIFYICDYKSKNNIIFIATSSLFLWKNPYYFFVLFIV